MWNEFYRKKNICPKINIENEENKQKSVTFKILLEITIKQQCLKVKNDSGVGLKTKYKSTTETFRAVSL